MILIVIDSVLAFVLGFLMMYLAALTLLSLFVRKRTFHAPAVHRRFAVVVPAHNEESCIARTIKSLLALRYPKKRYDVIVVADNCTDQTADTARREGATVFERQDADRRGKGYALRWCFDRLLAAKRGYDAIAVIDADSIASPNFLEILNHYLEGGSHAVQVSDMVEPQPDAWSAEMTRFGFTLYNYVRPLGRKLLKCSAGVRGNGMCFSARTLREYPWNTFSLNEDLEYGLGLLLHGKSVDFAPETAVYAAMPSEARNAISQRSRWEGGRFPVIRKYSLPLLSAAVRRFSFRPFDALIELVTPPFVNMFVLVALIAAAHLVLAAAGIESASLFLLLWLLIASAGVFHVIAGLWSAGADRHLYRAFLHLPRYAIWKIALYARHLRRTSGGEWVRTARDGAEKPQAGDGRNEQLPSGLSTNLSPEDTRHV